MNRAKKILLLLIFSPMANTGIHEDAKFGNLDAVIQYIKDGGDIDVKDYGSWTPLMWAAEYGHLEIVVELLRAGANFNIADGYRRTAIVWATAPRIRASSAKPKEEIMEAIMEWSLNNIIHLKNKWDRNILDHFLSAGYDKRFKEIGTPYKRRQAMIEATRMPNDPVTIIEEYLQAWPVKRTRRYNLRSRKRPRVDNLNLAD